MKHVDLIPKFFLYPNFFAKLIAIRRNIKARRKTKTIAIEIRFNHRAIPEIRLLRL